MNTRNGTLSPVSTDSQEWSPITRYQNLAGENPYSPVLPNGQYPNTSSPDGAMLANGMRPAPNGNPSPPSSVGRSSDGTGLYASSLSLGDAANLNNPRKMAALEEALSEHFRVLKVYLAPYLNDEKGNPRPSRAKDKLTRLSGVQFQELSTDVYDESIRRELDRKRGGPGAPGNDTPKFLLPKNSFHPKRNQARQKLSTLPLERFRQLATDVFYELERRFPRFTSGADLPPRSASPAASIASRISNRGPPTRNGTPNSMNGRPPPGQGYPENMGNGRRPSQASQMSGYGPPSQGGYSGPPPQGGYSGPPPQGRPQGPPGGGGGGGLRPGSANNEFGRPLPRTFQSNTIIPNKGMMVEDDDDSAGDDDDAFNLEGAAARRQTNKSAKSMSMAQDKVVADLQSQVEELQGKVGSLEETMQNKDAQLQRLTDADKMRDDNSAAERSEWDDLRNSLEDKVEKAENLNTSLRSEIEKLRIENQEVEKSLRTQIVDLESTPPQQQANDDGGSEWKQRCEDLERQLSEQQQVTEEVRRDASAFLQEMRELSARSDAASEKEDRLATQVSSLELEIKEWKSRYARAKTQLRTLKASSIGLNPLASPDIANYARELNLSTPDGLVKDVHVTKFQLSIDELLQVARRVDPERTLESMRNVVQCVRNITGDVDSTPLSQLQSPVSSINGDIMSSPEKQQAKLKSRVSATANNLITATKNHTSSAGMSPVSLLDAAASHLSTAIVELVKHVKVRPTPSDELAHDAEDEDRPMALKTTAHSTAPPAQTNSNANRNSNVNENSNAIGNSNANGNSNGATAGHNRGSKGGSSDTTRYSSYSSPYSGYDRQSANITPGMTEFKSYLDDQTALLVQSIQPLVNLIRANPAAASEQQIMTYIRDIAQAVEDTGNRTYDTVTQLNDQALKKHAIPVVEILDECREDLLAVDVRGGREEIPPLAFRTARALKELVTRVERVDAGELTVLIDLPLDF